MYYTWSNRSEGGRRTLNKIDRCLVNEEWVCAFDQSYANFLPQLISDHSPILLTWFDNLTTAAKPFRFFNHWTKHDDFNNLVQLTWQETVSGNPMMRLTTKLKNLKAKLKQWSRLHFSDLSNRTNEAKENLERIQAEIQIRPLDDTLAALEKDAIHEYKRLSDAEEDSMRQKSGENWAQLGDMNTSYFHKIVQGRRNANRILSLTDSHNTILTADNDIAEEVVSHYTRLMGTENSVVYAGNIANSCSQFLEIPTDSREDLASAVTVEEVKLALLTWMAQNHQGLMSTQLISSSIVGT
ncbi:Dnase i-like superfamily protein [Thalictrum thalictroides]|uniref:Dnase i-like superfamily protein n=1 Tax=Thalictrum thalictroides TaxID=46969 RepID=A0A7J6V2U4_THATH|nr:Dnase i-like superfamily protein [Thalictrum thalictroides]